VHVPFCAAICNYCNFNRGLFGQAQKDRYLLALVDEISQAPDRPGPDLEPETPGTVPVDSIYFGGGTPSLLAPAEIDRVLDACRRSFSVSGDAEITLEANPESVAPPTLAGYRSSGITRLSFGVQSFRDSELVRLSRLHGAARARAAYHEAREAGFTNVSLDLMSWLPGQHVSEWLESVEAAVDLGPEHLSLYMLEVYPNAPLRDEMVRGQWSQAPDDDAAEMYLGALNRLERAGYRQYEISNVARPGYQSRHNLKYWQDGEWRGFGPGAHSTRQGVRWKNVSAIDEYIACGRGPGLMVDIRRLTPDERAAEALFTALRLSEGIRTDGVRDRYGVDVWARYGDALGRCVEAGLLLRTPERLALTRQGMLLAHEVMAVFV
jgi:oxygen-independent coproporphyrinogen-3 oxidase